MEIAHDVAIVIACYTSLWWLYAHPTRAQRESAARAQHADKEGWN